ncbi:conserved hypothetical protein [Histoplasma capsulatum var. duboisii H88]|uniref:Uncharacterized protein n=1 Tax=Ajellomyces capsulatus (strain H88) TaxID=544711 RepID=F0UNP7_AJEC8|nr:conserved hypothetical protein [Histoplasma capsulatum var. duboisii H88]
MDIKDRRGYRLFRFRTHAKGDWGRAEDQSRMSTPRGQSSDEDRRSLLGVGLGRRLVLPIVKVVMRMGLKGELKDDLASALMCKVEPARPLV